MTDTTLLAIFGVFISLLAVKACAARICELNLTLRKAHVFALGNKEGVLFELEPDAQTYVGHVGERSGGGGGFPEQATA